MEDKMMNALKKSPAVYATVWTAVLVLGYTAFIAWFWFALLWMDSLPLFGSPGVLLLWFAFYSHAKD